MKELHDLKNMLCEELEKYGRKGDLTAGSLDVIDKLAHAIKNIDKIIEAKEDGYSGRYAYGMDGSYAPRMRDSRGRYMSNDGYAMGDGYSRHDNLVGELRYLMKEAPDEHTRMEFQKFINKLEQM